MSNNTNQRVKNPLVHFHVVFLQRSLAAVTCLYLLFTVTPLIASQYPGKPEAQGYYEGRVTTYRLGEAAVAVAPGISFDSATTILGLHQVAPYVNRMIGSLIWCVFDTSRNVFELCDTLKQEPILIDAFPNRISEPPTFPNDTVWLPENAIYFWENRSYPSSLLGPYYIFQWNLHYDSLGDAQINPFNIRHEAHIRALPAWDITQGDPTVELLLIDVGIGLDATGHLLHRDFDSMFVKKGKNYIFPNADSLPRDGAGSYSHGTETAGIISATINNHLDIAGIAPHCILYASKYGDELSVLDALRDACSLDVDIVVANVQYFLDAHNFSPFEHAVRALDSCDKFVVAARGNFPQAIAPSAFAHFDSASGSSGGYRNVVSVGTVNHSATNGQDHKDDTSRGTVGAPSEEAYPGTMTLPGFHSYGTVSFGGTSAATPHVAGVAALIKSHFPEVEPSEIRSILEATADKLWDDPDIMDTLDRDGISYHGSEVHPDYGYGRVNAFRSLNGWYGTIDSCDTSWETSTLYAADNRVYIADLTVGASCNLSVDAGIEVRAVTTDLVDGIETSGPAGYPCELVVDGHLIIDGSPTASVLFSSTNDSLLPAWYGIRVRDGGRLSIRNATIANAKVGITVEDGGILDTLIDVHFVDCETALKLESDTLLLLKDVVITGSDSAAIRLPEGTEVQVLGSFEVQGDGTNKALFACTNDSTVAAWDGIHVTASGSLAFSYVDIRNASTAILVDSGGVVDTPFVNCNISDCLVAFDLRSGTLKLRDVAMTGVHDYGIDASVGTATIRLQDSVAIVGIEDSSTAVSVSSGGKLVAVGTVVQDGYLGFEIRGSGADTVKNCKFADLTWSALFFREGTATDYSSGNVIEKEEAGSIDYGFLIMDQSVTSVGDTVRGGYVKDVYFAADGRTFDTEDLYVDGKIGDDYGLFATGNSSTVLVLNYAKVDSFFATAHLYVHTGDVEIMRSRFVTHASSADASPYGVWDRSGTSGHVRCSDILHQKTVCVMRDDASCHLIWDGWGLHASTAGWNAIKTTHTGAYYVKNTATDTVDFRKNWWGGGAASSSRMSGKIKYSSYITDSSQCGGQYQKPSSGEPEAVAHLPVAFALEQNIPNPFNPSTEIRYALPLDQYATLTIYNVLGQVVRQMDLGWLPAGLGSVRWHGNDHAGRPVGSGMYFYRFASPAFTETRKMLLLR